ncbi:MAG: hypothetical protein AAFP70_08470 [Calditrichota bacterium]
MKLLKVDDMTNYELVLSLSRTISGNLDHGLLPIYAFDMIHNKKAIPHLQNSL